MECNYTIENDSIIYFEEVEMFTIPRFKIINKYNSLTGFKSREEAGKFLEQYVRSGSLALE